MRPGWRRRQASRSISVLCAAGRMMCAGQLCADAMRNAGAVAAGVAALFAPSKSGRAMPAAPATDVATDAPPVSTEEALARLKLNAAELGELRRTHRSATL